MAAEHQARFIRTLQEGYTLAGVRGLGGHWGNSEAPKSTTLKPIKPVDEFWKQVVSNARGLGPRF